MIMGTFHVRTQTKTLNEPVLNSLFVCLFVSLFVCVFCCFTSKSTAVVMAGRTVSSPNHIFSRGKLEQAVNQYFVHILSLVTDNNPS